MDLIKNIRETKYGLEGEVYVELFEDFIDLIVEKGSSIEFATQCAQLLNSLGDGIIDHLCRASEMYCNDFRDGIGEPQIAFEHKRAVLEKIDPVSLIVPQPDDANTPVVRMELNCEWEEEHGMEWVIRGGSVKYVGGFFGCNPYDSFESRDGWNYAWQTA